MNNWHHLPGVLAPWDDCQGHWELQLFHAAAAKSLQLCLTLCDPTDGSPPGSPVPGILQARTLEWVAMSFSNAWKWKVKSESEGAQSCPTLSDPVDCSPPGSSVHGIFQARILEWGAIAFSDERTYPVLKKWKVWIGWSIKEANEGRDVKGLKKRQVKPKRGEIGESVLYIFIFIQSGRSRFRL